VEPFQTFCPKLTDNSKETVQDTMSDTLRLRHCNRFGRWKRYYPIRLIERFWLLDHVPITLIGSSRHFHQYARIRPIGRFEHHEHGPIQPDGPFGPFANHVV